MANRKPIPNSTRFEVFKRDSFTCQYCGAAAPDVILNVDHINPVAHGGTNDILNLITSCFTCNSGKSDKKLSDDSVVAKQKRQLDELAERRAQLEMMMEWKMALADKSYELDKVMEYFNATNRSSLHLTETGIKNATRLLKAHGLADFLKAIDDVNARLHYLEPQERWEKIAKSLQYLNESEETKQKAYILGIVRNKFGNYRLTVASNVLDQAIGNNIDLENLVKYTKGCTSWGRWLDALIDYNKEYGS